MKRKLTEELFQLATITKNNWAEQSPIMTCDLMAEFKLVHRLSERDLAELFFISKSEVHRKLSVAALPEILKATQKCYGTDYHALCVYAEAKASLQKRALGAKLLDGTIKRHKEAKDFINGKV